MFYFPNKSQVYQSSFNSLSLSVNPHGLEKELTIKKKRKRKFLKELTLENKNFLKSLGFTVSKQKEIK